MGTRTQPALFGGSPSATGEQAEGTMMGSLSARTG